MDIPKFVFPQFETLGEFTVAYGLGSNFHEHLDKCKQCREQPFNLCVVGSLLLQSECEILSNESPTKKEEKK